MSWSSTNTCDHGTVLILGEILLFVVLLVGRLTAGSGDPGDDATILPLMPIGANPHTYSPTAQDVVRLSDADRVLVVGIDTDMCVLKVALDVFDPEPPEPGFTPGTLVVDISPDGKWLYIHAMYAKDPVATLAEIDDLQSRLRKAVFS